MKSFKTNLEVIKKDFFFRFWKNFLFQNFILDSQIFSSSVLKILSHHDEMEKA